MNAVCSSEEHPLKRGMFSNSEEHLHLPRRGSFAEEHSSHSSHTRRGREGSISSNSSNDPHYDLYKNNSSSSSSALSGARRPRRRPIDTFRELIILFPGDANDQMKKIGLTPAEIPEFTVCLEEQIEYDEEGEDEKEYSAGKECSAEEESTVEKAIKAPKMMKSNSTNKLAIIPSMQTSLKTIVKTEVYTPAVKINAFYEARQKKGCGFDINSLEP